MNILEVFIVGIHKVCSFFGHRKIKASEELKELVKSVVEDLIVNHNVQTFLFGSRSEFDNLCHSVVSELREKYSNIKRIAYTCKSEVCILESEREKWQEIYSHFHKEKVYLLAVEEEYEHKTKYDSGKASYVVRNQAMIIDSDFCVFYYDHNYQPTMRKCSKKKFWILSAQKWNCARICLCKAKKQTNNKYI